LKILVTKPNLVRLTYEVKERGRKVAADFEQMYNTYYMKVYSFAVTLTKNQHDAEEITQNTFFKAMTTERKSRGDASEFTWLCAIAKNLFVDEVRKKKPVGDVSAEVPSDTNIEKALVDEDMSLRIHQVLHGLEDPYKEVFSLRVFGELSFSKIGLIFGKTESWARVTHHRARLKIQEGMEE